MAEEGEKTVAPAAEYEAGQAEQVETSQDQVEVMKAPRPMPRKRRRKTKVPARDLTRAKKARKTTMAMKTSLGVPLVRTAIDEIWSACSARTPNCAAV